jgi:GTPase SAR1 family protein
MTRCVQIVMGPAGSGKSTYCSALQDHAAAMKRKICVANLDPAAENFGYDLAFDIKDLVTVGDVMDELELGPNGGLLYCMEYLLENMDWLHEHMDAFGEDDYIILDCPGQIELYTHVPIMRRVVDSLRAWGFNLVGVFVVDATFVCDVPKFISGSLLSLSAMIQMELPHINVLSKCDLVDQAELDKILDIQSASAISLETSSNKKLNRLTSSIMGLIDDFSQVTFLPLNINDEDSIQFVLANADHCCQFGEDADVDTTAMDGNDDDDFEGGGGTYGDGE